MFFSHLMLFPTFLEKLIWEYKTIISHLMFSSCFFLFAGNIVKCPVTYSYWLNGRWFLQIVDTIPYTVKPVFKGHCDERTPCDQGTLSQNGIIYSPC